MRGYVIHGRMSTTSGENDPKFSPHVGELLEVSNLDLVCKDYLRKLANLTENASWLVT